jgi:hypothetical protein
MTHTVRTVLTISEQSAGIIFNLTFISVANPDPYVFGPLGYGSVSQRYGSKSFYLPVLRIRIRDPVSFQPLDPGYGMENLVYISECLETILLD